MNISTRLVGCGLLAGFANGYQLEIFFKVEHFPENSHVFIVIDSVKEKHEKSKL